MGELAYRLQLRQHTAVELINRMEDHGLLEREPSSVDKREVLIQLTSAGEGILQQLSIEHRAELKKTGPELRNALDAVLKK